MLIRCVLSISLVLNGLGVVSADASTSAEPPCHGDHAAPASDDSQPPKDAGSVPTDDSDAQPECCRHAGCAGACLQHSPAATVLGIPFAVVTPASVVSPRSVSHSLPERPPLTRPPDA